MRRDNDENDLTINLGAIVQATDRDGDTVIGNASGLVITVDDDTPIALRNVAGTVDEDGVVEGAANAGPGDGIPGGPGDFVDPNTDGDNDELTTTGTVAEPFQSGADEPLTYLQPTDTTSAGAGLDVGRRCADLCGCGQRVTAEAGAANGVHVPAEPTTGTWAFKLEDQLDHPTLDGLPGDNTENDLRSISVADRSGDRPRRRYGDRQCQRPGCYGQRRHADPGPNLVWHG